MSKLERRKSYIARKSKELDKVTDTHKYRHRAGRIMHYNNLIMEINNQKIKRIVEGERLK